MPRVYAPGSEIDKKKGWGERRDLNPRPSVPQTDALPAELRSPPLNADSLTLFFYAASVCVVAIEGNVAIGTRMSNAHFLIVRGFARRHNAVVHTSRASEVG